MTDALKADSINSLSHPLFVKFFGDTYWWPVYDIGVDCPIVRIDVCGKLHARGFSEVKSIKDGYGGEHDPDCFWVDAEDGAP